MKLISRNRFLSAGYTLAEVSVAVGVLGLLGGVFFSVLNAGMTLSAKNTAVNAAHQEAREGILRMTRDIHASISVPQLRNNNHDSSYTVVSSFSIVSATPAPASSPYGPVAPIAAAVSFQDIASGPNYVWKDVNNPSLIMIKDNPNPPTAGQRLIVPFFGLEEDISKVTSGGSSAHSNVFIKADQQTPSISPPDFGGSYAITYYTERMAYAVMNGNYVADSQGPYILSGGSYVPAGSWVADNSGTHVLSAGVYRPYSSGSMQRYNYVISTSAQRYRYENGELHMFRQRYSSNGNSGVFYWQDAGVTAKYISSPKPFYVPLNSGGTADLKYIGVQLTARDPKSSNRGYLATASLLDTQIDYRSRLTIVQ